MAPRTRGDPVEDYRETESHIVAAILDALRNLFRTRNRSFNPDLISFEPPDLDRAERHLRIRQRARRNAKGEIPATADVQLDGPQERIVQYIEGEIAETKVNLETTLMGLDEQIAHQDVTAHLKDLRRIPEELKHELDAQRQHQELAIERAKEELKAARDEYEEYRSTRDIGRDPTYPDSRFNRLAFALFFVVLESMLNAYFFATGSEFGLLGGLLAALLFAMADIIVSFNLGRLINKVSVTRFHYRVMGGVGVLAFIIWASAYNLLIGHIREQQFMGWGQATNNGLQAFQQDPLQFQDASSWILVVLGLVLSIAAMIDGMGWEEPWHGYERRHRRLRRSEDEHAYQKDLRAVLTLKAKNDAATDARQLSDRIANSVIYLENEIARKEKLSVNYHTFMTNHESACRALIQTYRDENRLHRKTDPPAYFNEPITIDLGYKEVEDLSTQRRKLEDQKRHADSAKSIKVEVLQKLDQVHRMYCDPLEVPSRSIPV